MFSKQGWTYDYIKTRMIHPQAEPRDPLYAEASPPSDPSAIFHMSYDSENGFIQVFDSANNLQINHPAATCLALDFVFDSEDSPVLAWEEEGNIIWTLGWSYIQYNYVVISNEGNYPSCGTYNAR